MSGTFRYHCEGCGLLFTLDLTEATYCPCCGTQSVKIDDGATIECSDCAKSVLVLDKENCISCCRPLCNACAHEDPNAPTCAECRLERMYQT